MKHGTRLSVLPLESRDTPSAITKSLSQRRPHFHLAALGTMLFFTAQARSQVITQLTSPEQMSSGRTTIQFDDFPHLTPAQNSYLPLGVQFTRDDGISPRIYDVSGYFQTMSAPNVIATVSTSVFEPFTTHLNAVFTIPVFEIGAFFGNDQVSAGSFISQTLTVYDSLGNLLGGVTVASNNNSNVDQFIGLRSSVPFSRARFNNDGTNNLAVLLDDFVFTPVPEPGAMALFGLVAACATAYRRTGQKWPVLFRLGRGGFLRSCCRIQSDVDNTEFLVVLRFQRRWPSGRF